MTKVKLEHQIEIEPIKELYQRNSKIIDDAKGIQWPVCYFPASIGTPEQKANLMKKQKEYADLFCAAPMLLAACEEFVRKVESGQAKSTKSYNQMKEAIKKAKGNGKEIKN